MPGPMFYQSMGIDVLYAFVLIMCSLIIYFGTREVYKLSEYKGIKYFRLSFLYFALSLFFRSFIRVIVLFFNDPRVLHFSMRAWGPVTVVLFTYTSIMAVLCLLYSVLYKKWKNEKLIFGIFNSVALLISLITALLTIPLLTLSLQVILFVFVGLTSYLAYKDCKNTKKRNSLYFNYILLFAFWTLNMIDILIPRFIPIIQILIYLVSIGIFMSILYKVIRRVGSI